MSRPKLEKDTDPEVFMNFYWLKEELFAFCKEQGIPAAGSKEELTKRIHAWLKNGEIIGPLVSMRTRQLSHDEPLSVESCIPQGYTNDERHRAFFKAVIGEHFKFNVPFMNWMKENAGKTYNDAIEEWNRIVSLKKNGEKSRISSQFQYNQYTRDFFRANPQAKRDEAIKCWKYKKSLPGHNRYEDGDLIALNS